MLYMLCRNRVSDYATWRAVFDSHATAHRRATLSLLHVWRAVENPNDVFFIFEVGDIGEARAFIGAPGAVEAARDSGVLEGEYHFVEGAKGY
jgi:hypothetical protein